MPEPIVPPTRAAGSRGPARVGANLRDVAQRAGVSPATVSRVFAGNDRVNPHAREAVLAAAAELGYVVNGLARSMMGHGRRFVAFLVQEMVGPTFAELAAAAEGVATANGDFFVLCTTHGEADRERELIDTLREQRATAILLVGSMPTDAAYAERVREYARDVEAVGGKLVIVGGPAQSIVPSAPSVNYDHTGGVRTAVRHLLELGHRRILYVGAQPGFSTHSLRLEGYVLALKDYRAEDEARTLTCSGSAESAAHAMAEYLDGGGDATAVMCETDNMAVGVLRSLRDRGIRVPADMSVVGFDDMPLVADLEPPLTTVRAPFRELGRRAGLVALDLEESTGTITLPTELIVRSSTGPVPVEKK
ncbi:LacI family DNA-binding transcriptional regulator [Kribbella sp. CA-245084]|uniref:LacI family DNA-binding transcriptional regulator n=1 Tax=Kribbella sp. CA-245084 TaxID=3239940 RepID=UPI003D8EE4C6